MQFSAYNFEGDEQHENCTLEAGDPHLTVLTIVREYVAHKNDTQSFRGGGTILGHIVVRCQCGAEIWRNLVDLPDTTHSDWARGQPCPQCQMASFAEYQADWKHYHTNGHRIADRDRLTTIFRRCTNCDAVVRSFTPPI